MSGLVSALILLTPTHQLEEMCTKYQADWVTAQFQSTRNAVATNPFSEWLWGVACNINSNIIYFPVYAPFEVSKTPKDPEQNLRLTTRYRVGGYRESGEFEILWMNWKLYRKITHNMPADTSAWNSRGYIGQQANIMESENSPAAAAQGRREIKQKPPPRPRKRKQNEWQHQHQHLPWRNTKWSWNNQKKEMTTLFCFVVLIVENQTLYGKKWKAMRMTNEKKQQ